MRRRGDRLVRLLHHGDEPVVVRAWAVAGAVRVRADASSGDAARHGVERMRFALGVDHDLRPFRRRFRRDPLLGPLIRRWPWLRPARRPEPFEALAWAVTEQLIEAARAAGIQRRLAWRFGRQSECGSLRDSPSPEALRDRSPAELEACDLAAGRSLALIRAAREVASGRAVLDACHEPAWRRLRTIPGIGSWTTEKLALEGQGRDDQLPAGDLAFLKLVGAMEGLGRRASEEEVRAFFAPYAPFQALAGVYLVRGAYTGAVGVPRAPGAPLGAGLALAA